MNRDLYALHDVNPQEGGAVLIPPSAATLLNDDGCGIFWTVNDFGGERRKIDNLKRINSFYVELDEHPKHEQLRLIETGLIPSLVVESKRGFQIYFNARPLHSQPVAVEAYKVIQARLVEFYGGDPRAKDIARILRAPGYNHMKDPTDPFPVEIVWEYEARYTPAQMLYYYPPTKEERAAGEKMQAPKFAPAPDDGLFEKVYNLDCRLALTRLSGTRWVRGEVYTYRSTGAGRHNILVNGKSTSCWVDSNGRIGSASKGGPTIWQWLKWFGWSGSEIHQCLKDNFPEVFT